ncbi:hypothetical protein [Escherichia phage vB_EcoM_EP57]|nr:hypothetical protein [Escherichia phage vB_EcoM_EP57]
MTEEIRDYYLAHYVYYFANATQKGEGNLYLATGHGTGVRKSEDKLQTPVVVVMQNISYLASCTETEFNASETQSNEE